MRLGEALRRVSRNQLSGTEWQQRPVILKPNLTLHQFMKKVLASRKINYKLIGGINWPLKMVTMVDVNYPDRSATTILAGGSGE